MYPSKRTNPSLHFVYPQSVHDNYNLPEYADSSTPMQYEPYQSLEPLKPDHMRTHLESQTMSSSIPGASEGTEVERTPVQMKLKRKRQFYTVEMLAVLLSHFKKNRWPTAEKQEEIALQLEISARRVAVWFKNRRRLEKLKEEKAPQKRDRAQC